MIVAQLVKNLLPFLEHVGSLSCLKVRGQSCLYAIAPCILNKYTRWRLVVSFTPWPLFPHRNSLGTYWLGDWVGFSAGVDAVVEEIMYLLSLLGIGPQFSDSLLHLVLIHRLYATGCIVFRRIYNWSFF
jgi:hypothetical protein